MVTPESDHLLILTTAPDPETGASLARGLVEARLAACVNVLPPMTSYYLWKDALETTAEHQLLAKLHRERLPEAIEWLRVHHPYELPEVIAIPIVGGLPEYLEWLTGTPS